MGLVTPKDYYGHGVGQSIAAHTFTQSVSTHPFDHVPVLALEEGHEEQQISAWIKEHRPEAVIGCTPRFLQTAAKLGLSIPEDLNYVGLSVNGDDPGVSGIASNFAAVGETAIDTLNQLLQRGITTVNSTCVGTHVEGTWQEGRTLLAREILAHIG